MSDAASIVGYECQEAKLRGEKGQFCLGRLWGGYIEARALREISCRVCGVVGAQWRELRAGDSDVGQRPSRVLGTTHDR